LGYSHIYIYSFYSLLIFNDQVCTGFINNHRRLSKNSDELMRNSSPLHYLAAAEYAEEIVSDIEDSLDILLEDLRELESAFYRSGREDEGVIEKLAMARNLLITAKREAREVRIGLAELRHGRTLDAHSKDYEELLAERASALLKRALALMSKPEKALDLIKDLSLELDNDQGSRDAVMI
jgi:hypothetical protein